ncbi:uncharacterized protein TNCT_593341 [Trichonephila clavata]|uniref:Matrin-type domain-containing protein n=1 Tax=Trichonephila clavata TaxID=2740835 RepID=A0A8X6FFL5_TRICU|nr:uncharacterized protein TNCT_593341 [Trichonephila clavata]
MTFFKEYILENPPPPNDDFDYLSLPETPEYFLWPTVPTLVRPGAIDINYNLINKSFYRIRLGSEEESSDTQDQIQEVESNVQAENNTQIESNVQIEKNNSVGSSVLEEDIFANFSNLFVKREITEIDQDKAPETSTSLEKTSKKTHKKKKKGKHKERKQLKPFDGVRDRHSTEINEDSNSGKSYKITVEASLKESYSIFEKHSVKSEYKSDYSSDDDDERHSSRKYGKTKDKTYADDERTLPTRYQAKQKDLSPDEERHHSRRSKKGKDYEERRHSRRSRKGKDYSSCDEERHHSKRSEKGKDYLSDEERRRSRRSEKGKDYPPSDEERVQSKPSEKGKDYLSDEGRRRSRRSEKGKDYPPSDEERVQSKPSEKGKDYLSDEERCRSRRSEKGKGYSSSDEERHHFKQFEKEKHYLSSDEERHHSRRSEKAKNYLSDEERHSYKKSEHKRNSYSGDERHHSKWFEKEKGYLSDDEKKSQKDAENSRSRWSKDFIKGENFSDDENSRGFQRNSDYEDHYRSPRGSPMSGIRYFNFERSRSPEWKNSKNDLKRETENELGGTDYKRDDSYGAYYCSICQLQLSSEATLQSHLNGKRHLKNQKSKSVPEITQSTFLPVTISKEHDPYDRSLPPVGMERVELFNEVSTIQRKCDTNNDNILIVLENVWEIRSPVERTFYCKLCDSPCASISIMAHLNGFKHQLKCLKYINLNAYEGIKDCNRRRAQPIYSHHFELYQRRYGRGKVKVFLDSPKRDSVSDVPLRDQPGPSWRGDSAPIARNVDIKVPTKDSGSSFYTIPKPQDCLDTSAGDYHCIICDCHMTGISAWEAHVTGKRHLKKIKKCPQGPVINSKFVEAPPGTVSDLEKMLEDRNTDPTEVIFGLQYIRENRGEMGNQYNCFPCGNCSSAIDIIPHVISLRHKMKCLETMHSEGKVNNIMSIKALQVSEYCKENLVDEECCKVLSKFGAGKPVVYIAKDPITGKPIQRL